ncbi:MAG: glycoside hydrolase family 1 protein [Longicatena sp.]
MLNKNFLWGSSTNAQQFEGGYNKGNKGISISDVRKIPNANKEANFEDFKKASQHYEHYKEDIAYLGEMGFQCYRFTIAWSRIFPNGDDAVPNQEGLDFYSNILTELEKYNIKPIVELYAYDLPYHLIEKYNGFLSRDILIDFEKYARCVVNEYKGRVSYWVPFNEPNFLMFDTEYAAGYKAKNKEEAFKMEHHMNLAYANTTKLIHEIDSNAKTGGSIGNICPYPATCKVEDVEACETYKYIVGYNFADIYARKEYSKYYLKTVEELDLSKIILPGDMEIIHNAEPDFLSLTYYHSSIIKDEGKENLIVKSNLKAVNPYLKQTEWKWNIDPYGIKHFLKDYYHRYQLPILILENGLGYRDQVDENGMVQDDYRIEYLRNHIERMKEAYEEGVDIIGYLTWSAIDLYSTREGFQKRYGFVHVDKENDYKRRPKKSFEWYKNVIASNGEKI